MKTITGTSHFPTLADAVRYYTPYHFKSTPTAVLRKINEKEIYIGAPKVKPGQRLFVKDGRYHIEE